MRKLSQALPLLLLVLLLPQCVTAARTPPSTTPPTPVDAAPTQIDAGPTATATSSAELASLEKEMYTAVNNARRLRKRSALRRDETMDALARGQAQDMAVREYLSDITPEGLTYEHRLAEAGLAPAYSGENWHHSIHSAHGAVDAAFQSFMDSTPDQDNILQRDYTRLGVGVASSPDGGYIFVLTFASEE